MNRKSDRCYFPTFKITAETDEPARNAINAMEGPQTLAEVIENCKLLDVDAELRDEPGFVVGWVKADGSYRLN